MIILSPLLYLLDSESFSHYIDNPRRLVFVAAIVVLIPPPLLLLHFLCTCRRRWLVGPAGITVISVLGSRRHYEAAEIDTVHLRFAGLIMVVQGQSRPCYLTWVDGHLHEDLFAPFRWLKTTVDREL